VVRLPGAPAQVSRAQARRTGSRSRPAEPQPRPVTGPDVALLGLVGVVVLSLLWFSLVPLRASRAVYDGDAAYAAGDGNAALTAYERAVDLVPGSSGYRAKKATVLSAIGQNARALAELRAALEVDPYNISVARTAGQLAEVEGDLELAREMYVRANELVPSDSSVIAQLAVFDLKHSRAAEARELLETWAPRLPEALELWVPLGDARAVLGDPVGAREAYERKLELKPDDPDALEGLRKLDAAA
jgi:tetratricopeptide (TPR) repeat protein